MKKDSTKTDCAKSEQEINQAYKRLRVYQAGLWHSTISGSEFAKLRQDTDIAQQNDLRRFAQGIQVLIPRWLNVSD